MVFYSYWNELNRLQQGHKEYHAAEQRWEEMKEEQRQKGQSHFIQDARPEHDDDF